MVAADQPTCAQRSRWEERVALGSLWRSPRMDAHVAPARRGGGAPRHDALPAARAPARPGRDPCRLLCPPPASHLIQCRRSAQPPAGDAHDRLPPACIVTSLVPHHGTFPTGSGCPSQLSSEASIRPYAAPGQDGLRLFASAEGAMSLPNSLRLPRPTLPGSFNVPAVRVDRRAPSR